MPLAHYDIILGQSWPYQDDPIFSFWTHKLNFVKDSWEVELDGLFSKAPVEIISALQGKRSICKKNAVTTLLFLRSIEDQDAASTSTTSNLEEPYFAPFRDLLSNELPLQQPINHSID